jgi:transcriptional regulator with XRE-family HTH domain
MKLTSSSSSLPSARELIAANIRRLRKARNLSQEQLAELAQLHRTYVSQLERCVTNISINRLERLARVLGVEVSELLHPLR